MMTAQELAIDLVDWYHDNIDGEPAVESVLHEVQDEKHAEVTVNFTDGTRFVLSIVEDRA